MRVGDRARESRESDVRQSELAILGGGPAGLALAFYAHRSGVPFYLFEKSSEYGGLCRTFRCGEHLYDSGAHRFHDRDPEITQDLRSLLSGDLAGVDAPSQIFHRGAFIDFPPTPLSLLKSCGALDAARVTLEILGSRLQRRRLISFADFATHQFGTTLARRFLINYSEKVWGLPAEQLSPEIATRRLQGMTLRSLLFELIRPSRKAEHLDGEFLYPRYGYGQITERLKAEVPADRLRNRHAVTRLECKARRIRRIHFANGEHFDSSGRVVSTLPLTFLVNLLEGTLSDEIRTCARRLRFRHIRLLFLRIGQPSVSKDASIYISDPSLCISRVSEPRNRSYVMAPNGETSLVAEIPCFETDLVYGLSAQDLADRVIQELDQIGLVDSSKIMEWQHHFLAFAYPVYSLDYSRSLEQIERELATSINNLDLAGRSGRFFYSHLHDQLRFAKDYVTGLK
jgi:protoporphyrinogen oxidase